MPINLPNGADGSGESGLGVRHGSIGSPQGPCGYEAQPNGGGGVKGGEPQGPFGQYKETNSLMNIIGRDSLAANPNAAGSLDTPMDTSSSALPGVNGSSGTGPTGPGTISSPWSGPFGNTVK